jgi:hypothetical protein
LKIFAAMGDAQKMLAVAALVAATAAVLATVHQGALDAADAVVLFVSLAVLARMAIRLASDPAARRRREL